MTTDTDRSAKKNKRQKKRRRAQHNPFIVGMNLLMTLAVIGTLALCGGLYWGIQKFTEEGPLQEDTTVLIPPGASLARISSILSDADVISDNGSFVSDVSVFETGVKLYSNTGRLKAGEYPVEAHASMLEVMETLVSGKSIQHKIPVPEGYSTAQVVKALEENETLTGEITSVPPEGSILPDTYLFTRGATRQEILNRMQEAHNAALQEIWENRDPDIPVTTPEELVILASIVEKETAVASERGEVAGVFVNRLNKGQKLESDPTILYGLYKGEAWTRPRTITRSELDAPNDYSTYQIPALPPGPIANPGREAMEAVANPVEHDYFFFVADGSGGHAFAKTYEEHLQNVERWREIERQRGEQPSATVPEVEGESGALTDIAPESSGD